MVQSTMLLPSDFASPDAYANAVKALGDPPAHGDNPEMAAEHAALFHLVDRSQATHVAVKDGSWFDPTTWSDGQIPSAGARVLIPQAITVNYDGTSDTSLFTVRVDGNLLFATDHNTRMVLDTMVVAKTGHLQIGTSDHPVQEGVTADIVIANNGPINVNRDPMLLSRGIISHGTTDIHGQEKTTTLKLAVDPTIGSTTLVLEQDAALNGWHVGDRIVLTGTHIVPVKYDGDTLLDQGTQDEVLTIKDIQGATLLLDRALMYDHDTPRADLKAYVANYTHNIVVETQNAESVPVSQRGHVMFMHTPHVDVEYAEFLGLGRTDKSIRAVEAASVDHITSETNVKGRYAFHLHEAGVEPGSAEAIVKGIAVWGSPGWGIVQHGSNAALENNATYHTFGAAYVAETGDETGLWRGNIAIGAHGIGAAQFVDQNGDDLAAFDLARTGDGFWLQGHLIKVEHNIAAGVNEGFVYGLEGSHTTVDVGNLLHPEFLHGRTSANSDVPEIREFVDNEVFASSLGFSAYRPVDAQGHDGRSMIDNFKAWEVDTGMDLSYSAHYTIRNLDLIGTNNGRDGARGLTGIEIGTNAFDIVVNKANISNFGDGIDISRENNAPDVPGARMGLVFVDVTGDNISDKLINHFDPMFDKWLTSDQLKPGAAELDLHFDRMPVWTWDGPDGRNVNFDGIKTDSIGTVQYALGCEHYSIGQNEMSGLLSHQGYFTTTDGNRIVSVNEAFSDRATGEVYHASFFIQLGDDVPLMQSEYFLKGGDAIWRGVIDLNSNAITHPDSLIDHSAFQGSPINLMTADFHI